VSTWFVRESQSQLRAGELDSALSSAETASAVEPFAATASTQRALVLARSGELGRAAEAAREATREEPTNYRTWLLLASLDAERGRAARAIAAYDTAYDQNPHSIAFVRESPATFASRLKE
jgi:tetratricopeptide (TPR) repeat protein